MNLDLRDKTAFVTGASTGGIDTPRRGCWQEGAHVVVSYHRDHDGAQATAQGVQAWAGRPGCAPWTLPTR